MLRGKTSKSTGDAEDELHRKGEERKRRTSHDP
jgi:hypothetical protein